MSKGALDASAFELQPLQTASRGIRRLKGDAQSVSECKKVDFGASGGHSLSKYEHSCISNARENISKWNYTARTAAIMSWGVSPRDVLMTIPMPGIKEYGIGFRSRAITDVFWKKKLCTTSCGNAIE